MANCRLAYNDQSIVDLKLAIGNDKTHPLPQVVLTRPVVCGPPANIYNASGVKITAPANAAYILGRNTHGSNFTAGAVTSARVYANL